MTSIKIKVLTFLTNESRKLEKNATYNFIIIVLLVLEVLKTNSYKYKPNFELIFMSKLNEVTVVVYIFNLYILTIKIMFVRKI